MAVTYKQIDGELVSAEWYSVLTAIRQAGVRFNVNEGKRTMARQRYFWNCYVTKRCNGGNLAAYPNPNAPHIREGRLDHAIDFNNAAGVLRALRARGISAGLPVRGESWHVEASASDLRRYHQRHGASASVLPIRRGKRNNVAAVKTLQRRLRAIGFESVKVDGVYGRKTRSAVGRFQRKHKLRADYVVGRKTWEALARAVR